MARRILRHKAHHHSRRAKHVERRKGLHRTTHHQVRRHTGRHRPKKRA